MPWKRTGNRPMRGFRPDECFDALLKMYDIRIEGPVRPDRDALPKDIHLIIRAFTDVEMSVINWSRSTKEWKDSLVRDLKMPPPRLVLRRNVSSPVESASAPSDTSEELEPKRVRIRSTPSASTRSDTAKKVKREKAKMSKVKKRKVQKPPPKRIFFPNL